MEEIMFLTKDDINAFIVNTLGPDIGVTVFDDTMGYGYFDAFIGVTVDGRAVYSYDGMIQHIMNKDSDVTEDDAIDWINFNTIRALYETDDPIIVYSYDGMTADEFREEMEATGIDGHKDFDDAVIGIADDGEGYKLVYDVSKMDIDKAKANEIYPEQIIVHLA